MRPMVIRWIIALVGVVLAVALGAVTFVIVSATIPESLVPLSFAVSNYGLYLIPAGLLGMGIGLILAQRRNAVVLRILGILVGMVCVVATVAACVPLVASWREAGRQGTQLSIMNYLTGGTNTGDPVETLSTPYASVDGTDLLMDVKMPTDLVEGRRAAVIWVHGGGFTGGDRGEGPEWHKWLNDRGYAVFAIEYRLTPPPRWEQAPGDIRCAVGRIKERATEFGIDPARVMLAGGSAGGNLALMGAYADERVAPSCPVGDTSVAAVTAFSPPTDLSSGWYDTGSPDYSHRTLTDYLGGAPDVHPDRYAAASPRTYVRPGLPPTLLMHGTRDHVVPFDQSAALTTALESASVPVTLVPLPYADHGFDVTWGDWATQISRDTFDDFLARYFPAP